MDSSNLVRELEGRAQQVRTFADFLEAANLPAQDFHKLIRLTDTPFPHQLLDLNHLARFNRSALWNEPGTGKTYPSQAHALWLAGYQNRTLCIMPPILVGQFHMAFRKFEGHEAYFKVEVFDGTPTERSEQLQRWMDTTFPDIVVMTYQMFMGKLSEAAQKKIKKPSLAATWTFRDWAAAGYNNLLVDEATCIKHASSQLHKAVRDFTKPELLDQSNGLVLMTGTPIENTLMDAYGYISLLLPQRYGSHRAFERIHAILAPGSYGKIIGYCNQEYLYQGLYACGRRVLKKDVFKDMPPLLVSEVMVHLSKEHQALYRKLVNERVLEIGDKVIDATTFASLRQKTQQILLTPEHYLGMALARNELIEALDTVLTSIGLSEHKVLVFLYFKRSIEKLRGRYKQWQPAVMYGDSTDREGEKARFLTDPNCRMMLAQVRTAGIGLNLQGVCSHVVVVEAVGVPGWVKQAYERVFRYGQTETVNLTMLTVARTVSVSIRNDLCRKDGDANDVVRDARTTLRDLLGEDGVQGQLA